MTRASNSNPEMERVVKAVLDWLTIRANEMPNPYDADWIASLEIDADHSALLSRLLDGEEPMGHKPPLYMSYPWYSLIENGYAIISARFCHHHKKGDGGLVRGHYWHLGQQAWWVTEQDGETFFLRHPYGWTARLDPATFIVKRIVHPPEKAKTIKEPGYRLIITGWKDPEEHGKEQRD